MLQEALPHEIAELQLLSNLRTNEEFRKVLPKLEKTFFERPEHRVVFGMLKDYITEFNEPPTKEQLKVNLATVGFTKEDHFEDGLEPQINHTIDALSDQPDNTDWLLTRAQQLYVEHTMMPLTLEFYKNIKAGKAPDFTKLQDAAKASLIDEGDGTKLKLETITHHFEQGKTLAEQLKNPSYRIKHLLPESGVGVFTGPSGTGKTFAIDHLIAHLVTGRRYFGKRVKPCNVLYVYAEGGAADIDLRLEAHAQHYGNDDFNTEYNRLSIAPCIWNLCDETIIPEIIAYIIKHDIKFVVLETLGAMLMDGTVNDDEVVRKYIAGAKKIADQCNCTLLIVHHPPKGGTSDYLGSVTIKNNPDFLWVLWKNKEDGIRDDDYKAKEIMLTLYCDKCKFAPDGWKYNLLRKEVVIGIDDEGDDMTSIVVETMTQQEVDEMIETGKAKKKDTKIVKLTGNALKLETLRQECFGGRDVISIDDLKTAAQKHSVTKDDSKDIIRHLAARGVEGMQSAGVKVDIIGANIVWGKEVAEVAKEFDLFAA
jgi:AAA domain